MHSATSGQLGRIRNKSMPRATWRHAADLRRLGKTFFKKTRGNAPTHCRLVFCLPLQCFILNNAEFSMNFTITFIQFHEVCCPNQQSIMIFLLRCCLSLNTACLLSLAVIGFSLTLVIVVAMTTTRCALKVLCPRGSTVEIILTGPVNLLVCLALSLSQT